MCLCDIYVFMWHFQIVILVVDSTDRERLTVTKEELHQMLAHEVQFNFTDVCVSLKVMFFFLFTTSQPSY